MSLRHWRTEYLNPLKSDRQIKQPKYWGSHMYIVYIQYAVDEWTSVGVWFVIFIHNALYIRYDTIFIAFLHVSEPGFITFSLLYDPTGVICR